MHIQMADINSLAVLDGDKVINTEYRFVVICQYCVVRVAYPRRDD